MMQIQDFYSFIEQNSVDGPIEFYEAGNNAFAVTADQEFRVFCETDPIQVVVSFQPESADGFSELNINKRIDNFFAENNGSQYDELIGVITKENFLGYLEYLMNNVCSPDTPILVGIYGFGKSFRHWYLLGNTSLITRLFKRSQKDDELSGIEVYDTNVFLFTRVTSENSGPDVFA